jgi:hypothetical protein
MQLYEDNAQDLYGNARPSVSVLVSYEGSPATIYSDNGVTPKANPLTTGAGGSFSFYAANGVYTLTAGEISRTVTLFDSTELATAGGAALIGNTPAGSIAAETVQDAINELDTEKTAAADLAASGGSALVGYDGGTAQDVLDDAKPMQSYTALRAYTGRATGVRITSAGVAGFFARSATDVTSADNGGTIIVDGSGRRWLRLYTGAVNVKWFGAAGDGVTDDTAAFAALVTYLNANGGECDLGSGNYLVDAGTIDLTRAGTIMRGRGKGNAANLTPSTAAPTTITLKGTGAGLRAREQSIKFLDFRLTSDATREALSFDITQPGLRIEPADTPTARADRCAAHDLRIDKQPGDGVLLVGSALYFDPRGIDVYECKGFGFRLDPGSYTGITRTNTHYPGLSGIKGCRVGYCGGHALAASNPSVTTQSEMAIRLSIEGLDSFGNGQNTAIMYPSADGNFYDFWVFGENCKIENSAPCGRVGVSLTPELIGGIWIAGRDNELNNNRYIDTKQPIYWGYVAAQPSTGLKVDLMRIVNATLTHTNAIAVESASATGLRVHYDRVESFTNVATRRVGSSFVDSEIHYRGTPHHISAITNTGAVVTLGDDTVYTIPISGMSAALNAHGVLAITGSAVSSGGGIFHLRMASSSPIATKWAGETNTIAYASGGALAGTTGTDTTLNVSCDNTNIYIENRRGFSITFTYQIMAFNRGFNIGV